MFKIISLFSLKRIIIISLLFTSLTFLITYPLFFKLNKAISGFHSTDEPSVWYFWWLKYAHSNNINHADCKYISYPFERTMEALTRFIPSGHGLKGRRQ